MATCPECEYDEIDTEELEEGDTLACPECGKNLVVAAAGEVDLADEDEDLDDDDDEDDEDADEDDEDDLDDDEDDVDDEELDD